MIGETKPDLVASNLHEVVRARPSRRFHAAALRLVLMLGPALGLLAGLALAQTDPGTIIRNQAQVTYSVMGQPFTAGSNTDQITVDSTPGGGSSLSMGLTASPTLAHRGDTLVVMITIANLGVEDLPAGELAIPRPVDSILTLPPGWTAVDQGGTSLIATPGIAVGGQLRLTLQIELALDAPLGTLTIRADYTAAADLFSASQNVEVLARTPSLLEAQTYAPTDSAGPVLVPFTEYDDGAAFVIAPPPALPGGGAAVTDGPIRLATTSVLRGGQTLFVRLGDSDQNLDPSELDSIEILAEVLRSDSSPLDRQRYRLNETAPASGLFVGYLPSTRATSAPFDGLLSVERGSRIALIYQDDADRRDTTIAAVLVDPYGRVFDSASGEPVDGVSVTLVDADTDLPATVLGDDGVSTLSATVISGNETTDSGGTVYQPPPGGFSFPLVAPGNYRFELALPAGAGLRWPSTVDTAQIQTLPGAPFAIDVGSRGERFTLVEGPPLNLDLPLDSSGPPLWVRKTPSKGDASAGDFIQYRIEVESTRSFDPVGNVTLTDTLPPGFRYQLGSARVDGEAAADPEVAADGRTLQFDLGDLAPADTVTLTYVTQLGAVRPGDAVNRAVALGSSGARSNIVAATVRVREELMRSHTILVGRVAAREPDGSTRDDGGVAGVRIYLEDGTYVVTDERGMFHFEGIRPGVHVVQLDLDTLPEPFELPLTGSNTRLAGRGFSQFVDLAGGATWRVDFPVVRKPPPTGAVALTLDAALTDDGSSEEFQIEIQGSGVPIRNVRLTVLLPEGARYDSRSARLDGVALTEPDVSGDALIFRLGDRPADWQARLTLAANVDPTLNDGELVGRATLTFQSETGETLRTAVVENLLLSGRTVETREAKEFTVRPHFESLSAELHDADETLLADLATRISGLQKIRLQVIGYSDDLQVRYRSWGIFKDNLDLSRARAASVARYLKDDLGLTPDSTTVLGRGEADPVAENATEEGRSANRRVEVRVVADLVSVAESRPELTPKTRDSTSLEITGLRPGAVVPVSPPKLPDPEIEAQNVSRFDSTWIESVTPGRDWVLPKEGERPRIPSIDVGIQHGARETVELFLNGEPVSPQNFENSIRNKAGTAAFSLWLGVDLIEGDNRFEAILRGADGAEVARMRREIHYPGPPVRVDLVASASTLTADGVTPPVVALRFVDRDGHPAREDSTGEFRIAPPYRAKDLSAFDLALLPGAPPATSRFTIGVDGVARIELQPTTVAGEVKLVIPLQNRDHEVIATLRPMLRDWVLVGLAQGTVGYNTLEGHRESLGGNATEEDLYGDGRVAFYAKGRVRGQWLLTLAYDSEKRTGPEQGLYGTIDPGTYYTLYGDRSTQLYDAASSEKLFVRLERDEFFALFGDFDTNLDRTELTRYTRSLTGLNSRYADERYELIVFASDSNQAFVRDEIRGQGITGPYPLTRREIVLNSDKVRIQVRDRFRSEIVLSERALTRNFDYDIDYEEGTLVFREAVFATDESFNPAYVLVDYESFDSQDHSLTFGGRGQARIDERLEVGLTHVTEGRVGGDASLNGGDLTYRITPATEARVEIAHSSVDQQSGEAWLFEVEHQADAGGARAYIREVDPGFGLGQVNRAESGTRKAGVEGSYRIDDHLSIRGQAFRQEYLISEATEEVVEAETVYRFDHGSAHGGLRATRDEAPGIEDHSTNLLTAGLTHRFLDDRLDLLFEREQPIGGPAEAVNYPERTRLGIGYRLDPTTSVFVAQEWAHGKERDTRNLIVGLKSTPWTGAELASSLNRTRTEGDEHDSASVALRQRWALGPRWSLDAGLERIEVLNGDALPPLQAHVPFSSGSSGDSTATSLGASYNPGAWLWSARLDARDGTLENRRGISTSIQTDPHADLSLLFGLRAFDRDLASGEETLGSLLRMGLAYRPPSSNWLVLNDLAWIHDRRRGGALDTESVKLVDNVNANWRVERWQASFQYGSKLVRETIDGESYDGYTDLSGVEVRYDLTPRWDVGLRGSLLHAWSTNQLDYSSGVSVGRDVMKNVWLSLGYNFIGFTDRDFPDSEARSRGPYLMFRMKFDQQSLREALRSIGRPAAGSASP